LSSSSGDGNEDEKFEMKFVGEKTNDVVQKSFCRTTALGAAQNNQNWQGLNIGSGGRRPAKAHEQAAGASGSASHQASHSWKSCKAATNEDGELNLTVCRACTGLYFTNIWLRIRQSVKVR
jgi:hypothetical protein